MVKQYADKKGLTYSICAKKDFSDQTEFQGRESDCIGEYEDAVERVTLQRLLPPTGHRLIEIGAGSGRLADIYGGYDEVILFDQSSSQLREAQDWLSLYELDQWTCYAYCMGDVSNLPFMPGLFDTVVMARSITYAADVSTVLHSASQLLAPGGTLVLEFANKRNLRAVLRYLLRQQKWSPFDREPVKSTKFSSEFHPASMWEHLAEVGLQVREIRTISHFRFGFLRRVVPTWLLIELDRPWQFTGQLWYLAPIVFMRCEASADKSVVPSGSLFRCPVCGSSRLRKRQDALLCIDCLARFEVRDGIYDFKTPLR